MCRVKCGLSCPRDYQVNLPFWSYTQGNPSKLFLDMVPSSFVRLPSLPSLCLRFALFCLNIFLPFIQLLLFELGYGYVRVLFKLPLKFRNVLEHTESRSSLLLIKISKKTSPQRWRFYFAS